MFLHISSFPLFKSVSPCRSVRTEDIFENNVLVSNVHQTQIYILEFYILLLSTVVRIYTYGYMVIPIPTYLYVVIYKFYINASLLTIKEICTWWYTVYLPWMCCRRMYIFLNDCNSNTKHFRYIYFLKVSFLFSIQVPFLVFLK